MKKKDVQIGGRYEAKISGLLTTVRITRESPYNGWDAVNERTGRKIRIRSAAKLRGPARPPVQAVVPTDEDRAQKDAYERRMLVARQVAWDEALPDTNPPFYFRRVWTGGTDMDEVLFINRRDDGVVEITTGFPQADLPQEALKGAQPIPVPLAGDGLVIYGRTVIPRTASDRQVVNEQRRRGQIFAECFSIQCVEGEVGTHPLATVTEISREEFDAAREKGWA